MKMPTIIGIFIFISRENFMLNWVEHEKSFTTSWRVFLLAPLPEKDEKNIHKENRKCHNHEVQPSLDNTKDEFEDITPKTCLYNFDPLKPHFYIIKLGFTGVYIIFLMFAQKHRL